VPPVIDGGDPWGKYKATNTVTGDEWHKGPRGTDPIAYQGTRLPAPPVLPAFQAATAEALRKFRDPKRTGSAALGEPREFTLEDQSPGWRIFFGDLQKDVDLETFVHTWVAKDHVAVRLWNEGAITDIHVLQETGKHTGAGSAFVTVSSLAAAVDLWLCSEAWFIPCAQGIGHRQYPFRWLTRKWVMARGVVPGAPGPVDVANGWVWNPQWLESLLTE
jgi:hypothetical protein